MLVRDPNKVRDLGWLDHCTEQIQIRDAEIERLRGALKDAIDSVEFWAAYASDYFKEKHDLVGEIARLSATINPPAN
jgi:hypothetical protein